MNVLSKLLLTVAIFSSVGCNLIPEGQKSQLLTETRRIAADSYYSNPMSLDLDSANSNLQNVLNKMGGPTLVAESIVRKTGKQRLNSKLGQFVDDSVLLVRGNEQWYFLGISRYDIGSAIKLKDGDSVYTFPSRVLARLYFDKTSENEKIEPVELVVTGIATKKTRKVKLGLGPNGTVDRTKVKPATFLTRPEMWEPIDALWNTTIISQSQDGIVQNLVFFTFPKDKEMRARLPEALNGLKGKHKFRQGSVVELTNIQQFAARFR